MQKTAALRTIDSSTSASCKQIFLINFFLRKHQGYSLWLYLALKCRDGPRWSPCLAGPPDREESSAHTDCWESRRWRSPGWGCWSKRRRAARRSFSRWSDQFRAEPAEVSKLIRKLVWLSVEPSTYFLSRFVGVDDLQQNQLEEVRPTRAHRRTADYLRQRLESGDHNHVVLRLDHLQQCYHDLSEMEEDFKIISRNSCATFSLEIFDRQLAVSISNADRQVLQHLHHVLLIAVVNLS